jgi:transposase-like protein
MVKTAKVTWRVHEDAFRRSAAHIFATSGRRVEQVAKDLAVARSSLSKLQQAEVMAGPHDYSCKELARLGRETELLCT